MEAVIAFTVANPVAALLIALAVGAFVGTALGRIELRRRR